jgi:hypothetical protein
MGQATGNVTYNTFVKGLVTDSSNLNSDPNSIKDGYNFVLTSKGTLEKRLGLKTEETFAAGGLTLNSDLVAKTATTYDGKNWLVLYDKTTRKLTVKDAVTYTDAYTTTVGGVSLEVDFSFNDRFILVTSSWYNNIVLEYDNGTWNNRGSVEVKVRDFDGVDDGLDTDERPLSLNTNHKYNLENQGWNVNEYTDKIDDIDGTYKDLEIFYDETNKYPSNADIASIGRYEDPDGSGNITVKFRPDYIVTTYVGNSLAPRGKKILSTTASYPRKLENGVGITQGGSYPFGDTSTHVCNTFFAGRVFYGAGNNVMFSQTLGQDERKFGRCYQDADPTSSEVSDLIDTDGGMIKISGASGIYKLVELGRQLLVFAENGIWAISGGETTFTATEYSVFKVTTYTSVSKSAIVQVPSAVLFLSTSGIITLAEDKVTMEAAAQNLSKNIIQNYYNTFTAEELVKAKMVYSVKEESLYIALGQDVLVLNSTLGAYYKLRFPSGYIGMLYQDDTQIITEDTPVTYNTDQVTFGGDNVVLALDTTVSVVPQIRFLYVDGSDIKVKSMSDTSFLDEGAEPYVSYFVTTNLMFDNPLTKKRIPQLACWFEKTETGYEENEEGGLEYVNPSQCTFQVGWDMPLETSYSLDPRNKWSREYSAYRISRYEAKDIGDVPAIALDTIMTRTSVRGRGSSAMFRFNSQAGYDCRLLGWNVLLNQTTRLK